LPAAQPDADGSRRAQWQSLEAGLLERAGRPAEAIAVLERLRPDGLTRNDAMRLAQWLRNQGLPWRPVKGNGGWVRPAKNHAWWALSELAAGREIAGPDWARALDIIPAKVAGVETLTRGTKVKFDDATHAAAAGTATIATLDAWGATPTLLASLASQTWPDLTDDATGAREWIHAVSAYGVETVLEPRIQVGTVHGVKGAEADNVLLLSTITSQVRRSIESSRDREDEEARVAYVGVTRAREKLVVLREGKAQRMGLEMPALLSGLDLQ
jgi:superfamily I DNA/RNA helicase